MTPDSQRSPSDPYATLPRVCAECGEPIPEGAPAIRARSIATKAPVLLHATDECAEDCF